MTPSPADADSASPAPSPCRWSPVGRKLRWLEPALLIVLTIRIAAPTPARADGFGFVDSLIDDRAGSDIRPDTSRSSARTDDGRRTLRRLPNNLGSGFVGVFTKQNLKPFIIGSIVTVGGFVFDDTFRSALENEGSNTADFADDYGGPIALGALTTGLFVAGRYSEDHKFRAATYDMAIAAIVNLTYTGALKAVVDRDRPNNSGSDSFPSGHASNAFALAAAATQHYKGKLRLVAYGGATVIAASRLRSDAHWLSDILAGATLGILVGRGVAWMNSRPLPGEQKAGATISLAPLVGKDTYGVAVHLALP